MDKAFNVAQKLGTSTFGKAMGQHGVKLAAKLAPPQKFPKGAMITSIVVSLLFIIVYTKALAKKSGRECGRGWLALMMLPFVVGFVYIFFGKMIAYKNKTIYAPNAVSSMLLFTATTMIMQYFASAILISKHTNAPVGAAFKKAFLSLIFMGVSCALTIMSFVAFRYIIKNGTMIKATLKGIPIVGWIIYIVIKVLEVVWKIVDKIPIMKKLYTTYIHLLPAFGFGNFIYVAWIPLLGLILAPIALFIPFTPLAALGGHGMACEMARKEFPEAKKDGFDCGTSKPEDVEDFCYEKIHQYMLKPKLDKFEKFKTVMVGPDWS
jgi:hypothetical protein